METIHQVMEKVNEAVMGGQEPVSLEGAPAQVCIKTYMPNPGRERELEAALHEHYNQLKEAGLVRIDASEAIESIQLTPPLHTRPHQTAKPEPYFLRTRAGRVVEIFEWRDQEAMDEAHRNPATKATWDKLMSLATLVPLASLGEGGYVVNSIGCVWSNRIRPNRPHLSVSHPKGPTTPTSR